jgi:hypothetical protein
MELRRTAAERGVPVCVAIARTRTAARLLAHAAFQTITTGRSDPRSAHGTDVIIVEPGTEAESVAELPIELLEIFADDESRTDEPSFRTSNLRTREPRTPRPRTSPARIPILRHWGLRSLGELAALPADAVAARLGQRGIEWQRLARGEDRGPLIPAVPEERFEQAFDLEWPIEGLEPLSFVLGRLMDALSLHLERRDRGAAVLHVRLHLVTRQMHERSLQLPAPIRDARTLRTLALLDLESHSPSAAIDRVVVAVDPTPGRVIQFSLLTRPLPSPEQLSTLMARLAALMGQRPLRCGGWGRYVGARRICDEPVCATGISKQGSGIGDQGSGSGSPIPDPCNGTEAFSISGCRARARREWRADSGRHRQTRVERWTGAHLRGSLAFLWRMVE